jgi:hypothetical protein
MRYARMLDRDRVSSLPPSRRAPIIRRNPNRRSRSRSIRPGPFPATEKPLSDSPQSLRLLHADPMPEGIRCVLFLRSPRGPA